MSSPTGVTSPAKSCELLEWDSEFFGLRIARLQAERLDDARLDAALAWCEERAVDCLYLRISGDDRGTLAAVERRSFDLVDVRVDLSHDLSGARAEDLDAPGVRHAQAGDLPALCAIAREAFTGSRFFFDGRLPRDRCEALFETWVVRSVAGELADAVLVVDVEGAPAGFVTCERPATGQGRIGLLGVSTEARGQGAGRRLCQGALGWFADHGTAGATVTTQGRSVGAVRLYERCGFTTASVSLWYHRWFEREEQ